MQPYGGPYGENDPLVGGSPLVGGGGLSAHPAGVARLPDSPSSTSGTPPPPGTPAPPTYGNAPQIGASGGALGLGGGMFSSSPVNVGPYKAPNDQGMSDLVAQHLKRVLSGNETRYNPDVVSAMKSGLFATTQGRLKATQAAIGEDQASRGMYRSGQTGQLQANARMGADASYAQGVQDIAVKKADADFQDKMGALDRSEKWLEDMRTYALNVDMTTIERAKLQSNIALAWAKLEQDRQATNAQMALTWGLNEPREGRDYIYMDNGDGTRHMVWLSALNQSSNFYGQGA